MGKPQPFSTSLSPILIIIWGFFVFSFCFDNVNMTPTTITQYKLGLTSVTQLINPKEKTTSNHLSLTHI